MKVNIKGHREHRSTTEPEWSEEHSRIAIEEGWEIFETDRHPDDKETTERIVDGRPYGYRPFELQALNEDDKFRSDIEAHIHVASRALRGNATALLALKFLAKHSTPEFEAIMWEYTTRLSRKSSEPQVCVRVALRHAAFFSELRGFVSHKADCNTLKPAATEKPECSCGLTHLLSEYDTKNGEV